MNKMIVRSGVSLALLALTVGSTLAAPPKAKKATCPVCKMVLSTKKTKDRSVAVKIKGKTMYCCSACDMHAKHKKGAAEGADKGEKAGADEKGGKG